MNMEAMLQSRPLLLFAYRAIRECVRRWKRQGWRSGLNCFWAYGLNFYVRVANRILPGKKAECPCCGCSGGSFRVLDVGLSIVYGVECPNCRSQEWQRLLFLFFSRRSFAFMDGNASCILHIAPEKALYDFLSQKSRGKVIATDIHAPGMTQASGMRFVSGLMAVGARDETFDAVICIHVLEHIMDDAKASTEIHRILKVNGIAFVMVPFGPISETVEWGKPSSFFTM